MKIVSKRDITVGELLEEILETFGTEEEIEEHLQEVPEDHAAAAALDRIQEYREDDPSRRLADTRTIFVPDSCQTEVTAERLELLIELGRADGQVADIPSLSRLLGRQEEHVTEDVEALREIGLLFLQSGRVTCPWAEVQLHAGLASDGA